MKTESSLNIPNAQQSAHPFVLHDERGPGGDAFLEGLFGPGLTKLEDFAKAIMAGLMANPALAPNSSVVLTNGDQNEHMETLRHFAATQASLLLSELEKLKGLK